MSHGIGKNPIGQWRRKRAPNYVHRRTSGEHVETGREQEALSASPLQQGNKERVGTADFLCRKFEAGKGVSH
jgi:hypothetical protein